MATEDFTLLAAPGLKIFYVIWDLSNDTVFDLFDDTYRPLATAKSPYLPASIEPTFPAAGGKATYNSRIDLTRVHNGSPRSLYFAAYFQGGNFPDALTDAPAGDLSVVIERGQSRATIEGLTAAGTGPVSVDQDYGGENRLCYIIGGVRIDNAEVTFYTEEDFSAGNLNVKFIVATSRTTANGDWDRPVMLDPGNYVMRFHKQGVSGPDDFLLKVTADPAASTVNPL
jgi:hypothetical protein